MGLQVLCIRERVFQREMGFVEGIFAHCITERDFFESKVFIKADMGERGSCQHRERYEKFQVHHHAERIRYPSRDQLMVVQFHVSVKECRAKGNPVYSWFGVSEGRVMRGVRRNRSMPSTHQHTHPVWGR